MSGILRLESLTKGNTLKQGDKTPLKYRLFDADGEILNIAGKSAQVRLVYPDFLTIGYEKDGLTVAQDDTVTFTIDKVIPAKLYHIEIIVDDKFIFPSRADESKFTVDKSSLGTESSIIEIVGVDAVVKKAVDLINKDPNLIIDEEKLVNDIIKNTGIGSIEEYHQQFNDVITELSEDKDYHSLPEIVGARRGYSTLAESLQNLSADMLNPNLGKLTQNHMSDELLAQIAGDAAVNAVPADGSITRNKVASMAISPDKTDFIDVGKNLIDESKLVRYTTIDPLTGEEMATQYEGQLTDYIYVGNSDYATLTSFYSKTSSATMKDIITGAYYDKSGQFVAGIRSSDSLGGIYGDDNRFLLTIPTNAEYVRVQNGNASRVLQMELGNTGTSYEPYKLKLKNDSATPKSITSDLRTDIGSKAYFFQHNNAQTANISTADKTLTLYPNFYILHNNQRTAFTNQLVLTFENTQSLHYLLYDTSTNTFRLVRSQLANQISEREVTLAIFTLSKNDNAGFSVKDIIADFPITIDGVPYGKENEVEDDTEDTQVLHPVGLPLTDYLSEDLPAIGDPTCPFDYDTDTHDTIYNAYDELIANSNGRLTKDLLGHDEGGLPIYRFKYQPQNKFSALASTSDLSYPKILIDSAIHGDESTAVYSLYFLIDKIINSPQTHPVFEYISNYIQLEFIPLITPWGFNNKSYTNFNGIQTNRNFDWKWDLQSAGQPGENWYKGESVASESEVVVAQNWLNENSDALGYINLHTRGARRRILSRELFWSPTLGNIKNISLIITMYAQQIDNLWHKHYEIDDTVDSYSSVTNFGETIPAIGNYAHFVAGIDNVFLLEGFSDSYYPEMNTPDNKQITNMNFDILVNFLILFINAKAEK